MKSKILLLLFMFIIAGLTGCSHKLSKEQQAELDATVAEAKGNIEELKTVKAQREAEEAQTEVKKKKLAKQEKEKIRVMKSLGYEVNDSTTTQTNDSTSAK